ncbi:hypothetical protein DENIS_3940 [Desulfonema ishimotonii]|uniref:Uncharacterized protein n=1 Tax=Desulfonema ishimotonii TaxID=45657 RepID=A0A401G166_9BACT|nr:hypothetical protein [Desulfonema ishimotonii]GBC62955.1 hypothetical protein DENIS_3940 [Desulfonema ishimotonii]
MKEYLFKTVFVCIIPFIFTSGARAWNPFESKADVLREQRQLEMVRSINEMKKMRLRQDLKTQDAILETQMQPIAALKARLDLAEYQREEAEGKNRVYFSLLCFLFALLSIGCALVVWLTRLNTQSGRENTELRRLLRHEKQRATKIYHYARTLEQRQITASESMKMINTGVTE